jgi:pimeloyl-ACP methyl ester carboxylesterase
MTTYVLIHGASHGAWCWKRLAAELAGQGHDVLTPELPCQDEAAGLAAYADVVADTVDAAGERAGLVVVAHSLGALTTPHVCERLPVELLVLLAGMIPAPGQTGEQMFAEIAAERAAGRHPDADVATVEVADADDATIAWFYHDVPSELAADAARQLRGQAATPLREVWPGVWPRVPTRYLLGRADRILPAGWVRRVVPERLGIVPEELDTSHSPFLSRPRELAQRLEGYRTEYLTGR